MNGLAARVMLTLVLGIAAVELVVGLWTHRRAITQEDWRTLAGVVEGLPADEWVVLGSEWLGPRARLEVPRLDDPEVLGRADLVGRHRLHVVALGPGTWPEALSADLGVDEGVRLEARRRVGPFFVDTFELGSRDRVLASFGDVAQVEVRTSRGGCSGRGGRRSCGGGDVHWSTVEVDGRWRGCWVLDVEDDVEVELSLPVAGAFDRLRGHIGFTDFNGVLRNDAPVEVAVEFDGTVVHRFVAADSEGWRSFEVPTTEPVGNVTLRVQTTANGQWTRQGYTARARRSACLESRMLG